MSRYESPHAIKLEFIFGFYESDTKDGDPVDAMIATVNAAHDSVYMDRDGSSAGYVKPRIVVTRVDPDNRDVRRVGVIDDHAFREAIAQECVYRGWFDRISGQVWVLDFDHFDTYLIADLAMGCAFNGQDPLKGIARLRYDEEEVPHGK